MGMEQLRARDGSDTRHDLVTGNCLHGPVLDLAQPPQSLLAPHFVPLSLGELFLLRPGEAPRQFSCHSQALLRREVESGFEDLLACHRRYSTFSSRALAARLARLRFETAGAGATADRLDSGRMQTRVRILFIGGGGGS